MAVRDIIKLPEPILKTVSAPVPAVTDEVRALVKDMLDTMYAAPGHRPCRGADRGAQARRGDRRRQGRRAEAASMLHQSRDRLALRRHRGVRGGLPVDPGGLRQGGAPAEVRVRYQDLDGGEHEMHCTGLLATCIQHEIDHINGVLFIDHLSRLKRERIVKKFIKAAKLDKEEA
jgi:peptide deformylase